jgi:hypothetical protein
VRLFFGAFVQDLYIEHVGAEQTYAKPILEMQLSLAELAAVELLDDERDGGVHLSRRVEVLGEFLACI